jgi:hypothetical protein
MSQGRYLHRTTQREETRRDIYASSEIQTHDPVFERAKAFHGLYRATTVIDKKLL